MVQLAGIMLASASLPSFVWILVILAGILIFVRIRRGIRYVYHCKNCGNTMGLDVYQPSEPFMPMPSRRVCTKCGSTNITKKYAIW